MEIADKKVWAVFSCSWMVYYREKDYCRGQCQDEISKLIMYSWTPEQKREWRKIREWREKYHLNDMHAGTPKQEKWLKEHWIDNRANNYTEVCKVMKKHHMLTDNWYEFGTGWRCRPIPEMKLRDIIAFITEHN